MTIKILKATSKGQITLPKQWRESFDSDNFLAEIDQDKIIIKPLDIDQSQWEAIFDADRDNKGEGIQIDDLIKKLKSL